jgi:phage gp45-like
MKSFLKNIAPWMVAAFCLGGVMTSFVMVPEPQAVKIRGLQPGDLIVHKLNGWDAIVLENPEGEKIKVRCRISYVSRILNDTYDVEWELK